MLKRLTFAACALLLAAPLAAQDEQKPVVRSESKQATAVTVPEPAGLPVNIQIELAITDQAGSAMGGKKVVTMIVGDRQRNSIRSSADILVQRPGGGSSYRTVTINVDARPAIFQKEPHKMLLDFGLEYQPKSAGGSEALEPGMGRLNERLSLIMESGKQVIVSQAADPATDRKITVELTATILK